MLPDYIVYDELKKRREDERPARKRPQLEIPRYIPYWPEEEKEEEEDERQEEDRGVVIIQM